MQKYFHIGNEEDKSANYSQRLSIWVTNIGKLEVAKTLLKWGEVLWPKIISICVKNISHHKNYAIHVSSLLCSLLEIDRL